jgi:ABC-2 type transport system ATP-binding protein
MLNQETSAPPLQVVSLRKAYKNVVAVDGISFSVRKREIVGLLGPNGAGKTTTISMILGVLAPDSGNITVDGFDLKTHREQALSRANFAAVYATLPGNLTVAENLKFFGSLYNIPNLRQRVELSLEEYDLASIKHRRCGLLSSGEQTRTSIAKALLNRPALLLLDEPTGSLDPSSATLIRRHIRKLADENICGVLLTSHNMSEVQEICDRVLFMSHGKILLEGNPSSLPELRGVSSLEELFIHVAKESLTHIERQPLRE